MSPLQQFFSGASSFFKWCGKAVEDGHTRRPSSKRVGFLMSVTMLTLIMGILGGVVAGVTWSSRGTEQAIELVRIISTSLEIISGLVLTAVTGGYIGGKAVEGARRKRQDDPPPPESGEAPV